MATKIRLSRLGRKKRPFYRIMISDSRAPRNGRHIDYIGYYDPLKSPKIIEINREKTLQWLDSGAVPTLTVRNLLSKQGILLERELKKQGKTAEIINEELQKFSLLQDLKLRNKKEKKKAKAEARLEREEEVAVEEIAPAKIEEEKAEKEAVHSETETAVNAEQEAVETETEASSITEESEATAGSEDSPPEKQTDTAVSEEDSDTSADQEVVVSEEQSTEDETVPESPETATDMEPQNKNKEAGETEPENEQHASGPQNDSQPEAKEGRD